jgi:hypothetical protein
MHIHMHVYIHTYLQQPLDRFSFYMGFNITKQTMHAYIHTYIQQLLDLLQFYVGFEINEHTGVALSRDEMLARHYNRIQLLQRHSYKMFPELMREFALANIGAIETRDGLAMHLMKLSQNELVELMRKVRVLPEDDDPNAEVGYVCMHVCVCMLCVYVCEREGVGQGSCAAPMRWSECGGRTRLVCVRACVCVYIYIYTYIHTYILTCKRRRMHASVISSLNHSLRSYIQFLHLTCPKHKKHRRTHTRITDWC